MKRSGGKSRAGRQPEPVYFLDENTCARSAVVALRKAGARIEEFLANFPPGTRDAEWLKVAGDRGWVVISRDDQIRRTSVELDALLRAKVRKFTLVGKNMSGEEIANALVTALPRMRHYLEKCPAPFLGRIYRDGRVVMVES